MYPTLILSNNSQCRDILIKLVSFQRGFLSWGYTFDRASSLLVQSRVDHTLPALCSLSHLATTPARGDRLIASNTFDSRALWLA